VKNTGSIEAAQMYNDTDINIVACDETIEEINTCRKRWKDHVLNSWCSGWPKIEWIY
jgi:hypothetical protein